MRRRRYSCHPPPPPHRLGHPTSMFWAGFVDCYQSCSAGMTVAEGGAVGDQIVFCFLIQGPAQRIPLSAAP